jgi:hypothetical protein
MFIYDQFINVGNKVLAVTGNFELYGNPPGTTKTRLAKFAHINDT